MRIHAGAILAALVVPVVAAPPPPERPSSRQSSAVSSRQRPRSAADAPSRGVARATVLPNGWRIAPVGRHIGIGDLPLAMAESPDGRLLLVTNNGYARPSL